MARNDNHVRDRLQRLEAEAASLGQQLAQLQSSVARLLAWRETAAWLLQSALWLGVATAAHGATGTLGKFFSELARLLGRGVV